MVLQPIYHSFPLEGFSHTPIYSGDVSQTVFHYRVYKLEYKWMPFGLANSPAELQRQIRCDCVEPFSEGWAVIYMDDVRVLSRNVQELLRHLQ